MLRKYSTLTPPKKNPFCVVVCLAYHLIACVKGHVCIIAEAGFLRLLEIICRHFAIKLLHFLRNR